jgi:outer membrane protein assembly factor BamA
MKPCRWISAASLCVMLSMAGGVARSAPQNQPQKYPIIRRIEYHGLTSITEANILDRFNVRHINLSIEGHFYRAEIRKGQIAINELLAEHGHKSAVVTATSDTIPGTNYVRIVFTVDEGP